MGDKKFVNYDKPKQVVVEQKEVSKDRLGVVRCLLLRLRSRPYNDEPNEIAVLNESEKVVIIKELGDWLKVKTEDGKIGYVVSHYIREE